MPYRSEIEPHPTDTAVVNDLEANDRFTNRSVNIVILTMALVALLPNLFDPDFWTFPLWHIGLFLLLWLIYVINGTGGMMLHERHIHNPYAPYLYFGLQIGVVAGLFLLTRAINSSVWILALPVAAQSLSRGWLGTAVVSTILLGLFWLIYLFDLPWQNVIENLLAIGGALVFTLIFTNIAVRESSARSEIQRLATDLRQANHRLAEYAAQVEELATTRERNRVAREIHDNLGHYLTVVNVQIEAAKTVMESQPAKAQDALNKAQRLTQEGLTAVRQSVSSLRESPLADLPLAVALQKLVAGSREAGLITELVIEGEPIVPDPNVDLTLYRAVQEGLTNIRKHARASRADIVLRYDPAQTTLLLKDNGVGSDTSQENNGRFGLIGIQERVQLLDGQMAVETAPNQGFQFTIILPRS